MKYQGIPHVDKIGGYIGTIRCSFDKLTDIFCDPSDGSGDGKTRAEWIIRFDDGSVCWIYDWKEYNTPIEEVEEWNVGGDRKAFEHVKELISSLISFTEILKETSNERNEND